MIGIKLAGHDDFLDTYPDTSIRLRLENPLLGDDDRVSPGSFSYPFDLPAGNVSPKNAGMIKNPDVIENNEAFFKEPCDLFFAGVPFKKGFYKTDSFQGNKATGNFLFGLSQISDSFKSSELRDVVDDAVVIDNSAILKRIFLKRRDAGDYSIEVNGKEYDGTATAIETAINTDAANALDTGQHVPYCIRHTAGSSPLGGMTSTFLEIKVVSYETVSGTPTFIDGTDPLLELHVRVRDGEENYWCEAFDMDAYYDGFDTFFAGYLEGTYPDDRFRIPVTLNGAKYNDGGIENTEVVNQVNVYEGSGLLRNDANFGILVFDDPFRIINRNSLQPYAMLKWVLDKIAEHFGFEYEGDFYSDPKLADKLLFNSNALDVPQNFIGDKKFVFWRRSFNMNELVPKMKVPEFFAALQSRFNIGVYYNESTKRVRLQYREGIAQAIQYEDITSISSPLISMSDGRVKGITLSVPKDDKDTTSEEESFTIGNGERVLTVRAGRLHQMKFLYFGNYGREMVRVERNFGEEFDLRIFNYRGIVTTTPFDHPWAHIDGPGLDSYDIETIYNDQWKYWLHFQLKRLQVTIQCAFPFRRLLGFDWEIKRRYNRSNFLIKSIEVKLTNSGMSVCDVELITMK